MHSPHITWGQMDEYLYMYLLLLSWISFLGYFCANSFCVKVKHVIACFLLFLFCLNLCKASMLLYAPKCVCTFHNPCLALLGGWGHTHIIWCPCDGFEVWPTMRHKGLCVCVCVCVCERERERRRGMYIYLSVSHCYSYLLIAESAVIQLRFCFFFWRMCRKYFKYYIQNL